MGTVQRNANYLPNINPLIERERGDRNNRIYILIKIAAEPKEKGTSYEHFHLLSNKLPCPFKNFLQGSRCQGGRTCPHCQCNWCFAGMEVTPLHWDMHSNVQMGQASPWRLRKPITCANQVLFLCMHYFKFGCASKCQELSLGCPSNGGDSPRLCP